MVQCDFRLSIVILSFVYLYICWNLFEQIMLVTVFSEIHISFYSFLSGFHFCSLIFNLFCFSLIVAFVITLCHCLRINVMYFLVCSKFLKQFLFISVLVLVPYCIFITCTYINEYILHFVVNLYVLINPLFTFPITNTPAVFFTFTFKFLYSIGFVASWQKSISINIHIYIYIYTSLETG